MADSIQRLRRAGAVVAGVGVGAGLLSMLGSLVTATYFARRVVTPEAFKSDDVAVVAVGADTVTLGLTPDTLARGRYGLWLQQGQGHARLGDVLTRDLARGTVVRELHGVDSGTLEVGPARWNSYYYAGTPTSCFGYPTEDVTLISDVGELPAWLVPPAAGADLADQQRWAILVHGRSATRDETLRAVPVLHELGYTCLVPMYRNDTGAPRSVDGRYNLGLAEWRDVEAAIEYAVESGAQQIVLFGWSMGGAVVLQTLDRSPLSQRVDRVVLDAPVIDWGNVLTHHADLNRIPRSVEVLARGLIGRRSTRHLVGVHEPLDIAITDWVSRAGELRHPLLLIHSEADDVVPDGPSAALARRRPDLVTYVPWQAARHCREWNTDPQRWSARVAEFLTA